MKKDKLDQLDILISEVLESEINNIHISDKEIDEQWIKLQEKSKNMKITKTRKGNLKRVAVIIGALVGVTIINLPSSEISAWKVPNIINILSFNQNKTSINQSLSIGDGLEVIDEEIDTRILVNSIEEVRDILSFNFKELPYNLEDAIIEGVLEEEVLSLNYVSNQGKIRLIQMRQGLEFTQSVNVGQDSDVSELKINDTSYSIIKISEERTKVIWSSFGINYTLDVYYSIEIEEIKELIKAMK